MCGAPKSNRFQSTSFGVNNKTNFAVRRALIVGISDFTDSVVEIMGVLELHAQEEQSVSAVVFRFILSNTLWGFDFESFSIKKQNYLSASHCFIAAEHCYC